MEQSQTGQPIVLIEIWIGGLFEHTAVKTVCPMQTAVIVLKESQEKPC